jgi:hypothetical protein
MAGGLWIDIDANALNEIGRKFSLDEQQLRFAYSRALARTAATLRKLSSKGMKDRFALRNTKRLRRRIKTKRLRGSRGSAAFEIWYGQNDFPVRDFKGKPTETGGGVSFKGHSFKGAFVAKRGGDAVVFRRRGVARLPVDEVMVPVKDEMDVFIEDEIFDQIEEVFHRHFAAEVRARGLFGVGRR